MWWPTCVGQRGGRDDQVDDGVDARASAVAGNQRAGVAADSGRAAPTISGMIRTRERWHPTR